jgi:hypothetical protein
MACTELLKIRAIGSKLLLHESNCVLAAQQGIFVKFKVTFVTIAQLHISLKC